MKQRFYGWLAILMTLLLTVGVSASAGMYTYDPSDGEYWSPDLNMLDKTAVSIWLEDGTAAGYNDPNYVLDAAGASYLDKMESGWYEVILCGLGTGADDFPDKVNDRIALCIRGDSTFTVKAENAMNAGAVACLVGNNCREAEKMDDNGNVTGEYKNITMNMDYYTIPAGSLSSDVTVRLVAETADISIAEAVAEVEDIFFGAVELDVSHKKPGYIFIGTLEKYKANTVRTVNNTVTPSGYVIISDKATDLIEVDVSEVYQNYPSSDPLTSSDSGYATLEDAAAAIDRTAIIGYTFVTGTSGYSNEGSDMLWDNNTATKFFTSTFPTVSIAALDGQYAIDGIIMATANDNSEYNGRLPYEWAIYGSNNCTAWVPLAYGDDYFFEESNCTYYAAPLETEGSYKYFMFQSEGGLSGSFQLSEVVLCGSRANVPKDDIPWETYENIKWYFDEETGTLILGGEGAVPDVNSNQYPWKTYSSKIYTVVIKEGLTSLPKNAISSFGSFYVTDIRLPATLTLTEPYEFNFFDKLKNITIAEGNERYYTEDGVLFESTDDGNHLLVYPQKKEDFTSYTIPEGVTHIGERAFNYNDTLTSLNLPASLETIAETAFYIHTLTEFTINSDNTAYTVEDGILYTKDMTELVAYPAMHPNEIYVLPDSVTTISDSILLNTTSLETLAISESVTEIKDTNNVVFSDILLKEIIVDEDNPNYCSKNGILYSKDMKTLIFYPPCKENKVYRMPEAVTFIENSAFARLNYLEEIHFSPALTDWNRMGSIFSSTPKLTSLYYYTAYEPMMSAPYLSLYMSGRISKITVYYIEGKAGWTTPTLSFGFATVKTAVFDPEEKPDIPWETYENLRWYFDEETGTLTIGGEGAVPDVNFNKYPWYTISSPIISVVIEEGITEIPQNVVSSFKWNFVEISFPASLAKMNMSLLAGNYNLEKITVSPDNPIYYMKDNVLFGKYENGIELLIYPRSKEGTSYTVPEGVTRLGERSFASNQTLTELILPDSLEEIGDQALQLWMADTLHIPANVKEISPSGIVCAGLTEITIDPQNTVYIVNNGILYTKDMTELTVYPACHPNTSYTVPDTVTTIPNSLLQQAANIESLTIHADVTEIVDTNFYSLGSSCMKAVEVDANNPEFCDVDGVLYTKDMTTLIFYPPCKEDTVYRMPDTVTDMHYAALTVVNYLEELHLSPVIDDWYSHRICDFAPALTSVYFYEGYYAGIAEAFYDFYYYNENSDNITFYYLEGMSNWTSPTMSFGYADVKTAVFQLDPDDFGDRPWQVFQNILWYFDEETAALYLGGYGEIPELKSEDLYPWYRKDTMIEHLYIEDGVTGLNGVFLAAKLCNFYSVHLPATLTSFNTSPFRFSDNLEAFTMEKTNTNFYVEDGVLYLKNSSGKITFLCYPAGKKDKSYILPEGLTRIPSYGMWADALEEIILPESLVTINNRAFSSVKITDIHIPANTSDIGRLAFLVSDGLRNITVDPNNKTYTSVDGVLYTNDMKMLHTYPNHHYAVDYTVPDGVLEIPLNILSCGQNIRTLNLPASLDSIYTSSASFHFDCTLERIHVDKDNPYFSSLDGVLFAKDNTVLKYYPIAKTDTEYRIPDSVITIDEHSFMCVNSLETLYVGANVKNVYCPIARRCDTLRAVYFPAGVPEYLNDLLGKYYRYDQTILCYPAGAEGWTEGTMTVDGITYRTAPYTVESVPGDLTGDGVTDFNDVLVLAAYFAGHPGKSVEDLMDVLPKSFDGNPDDFSRYDAMYLARAIAGWDGYELP